MSMAQQGWHTNVFNHRELWHHSAGCGKYFNILRDTVTYEIYGTYKAGEWLEMPAGVAEPRISKTAKRAHEPSAASVANGAAATSSARKERLTLPRV